MVGFSVLEFRAKRQSKQLVKPGQGKSSRSVKTADRDGFGKRLREAFGGAKNADIARKMHRTESAVKNYIDGRIPPADELVSISYLTGCSVHWLLTGDGPKEINILPLPTFELPEPEKLTDKDRELVNSLIEALKRGVK